jgi:acyl-coenzyme A thioesterase PaaI-like protein
MRKPVNNPFVGVEGYNCFGCSPHHTAGLHMQFEVDGDDVISTWEPRQQFQGWHNVLHGGIQATLMDEIASWWVFTHLNTSGVTSKMEVKLLKTVHTNKGALTLRASLHQMRRNIAVIYVQLFDSSGVVCADSYMHYYTFPEKMARERLWYPGIENFLPGSAENA